MSIQPSTVIPIPTLRCQYRDCGNEWVPRTTRMPKVCPRCKRYGWETGQTLKKKHRGGKNVGKKTTQATETIGPKTQQFLELRRKET